MEEENRRETRQRSRSKTPLTLRSSVDRDIGDKDKKKSPIKKTVETITEESPAAPPTPATRTSSTRPKRNAAKTITSDYSSDDGSTDSARLIKDTAALIANSIAVVPNAIEQNITKTTTVITTKTIKSGVEQVPLSQSSIKSSVTTRSLNREVNQNDSNTLFEQNLKLRTSTPRGANSGSANSSYSENGVNLEEHPPFKEYKEAGEYWNKYPKTDYTYSKLSPHRRELTAGFVAMPNMSRRSLEHHNERVNIIAKTDPVRASFLRSRYESFTTRNRTARAADNFYDSQDEIDLSNGKRYYYSSASQSWIRRLLTVITTIISSAYYRVTDVFRSSKKQDLYYSRLGEQKKGIIRRTGGAIANGIATIFRYIYIAISTVLLLDSWLLRSKSASSGKKKGFLLLFLVLLPLLLLSGTYYYLDQPAPIPNINLSLDQLIDPKLYHNVKTITINNYNNIFNISGDYLLYLKAVAQDSANEARKLWTENFYN